ncbi:hypothetical protein N5079_06225 [Planotetraspora sp. A-T 1434]|uniref:hypothetical protein n=1 Tax=Planotetraspora sp. A-T 1434 TaxID=2979219 RepID=UPI0021C1E961|nr:hypothetical protein [Planotetraspora sp. A-T 1434]MCT9929814.1 hypothetical protein [Planotetraspora sp. A-T 1434]
MRLRGDALCLSLGDPLGHQHRVRTRLKRRSMLGELAVAFDDLHSSRFTRAAGRVLAMVGEGLNGLLTPPGCECLCQPGVEVIEHVCLAQVDDLGDRPAARFDQRPRPAHLPGAGRLGVLAVLRRAPTPERQFHL